MVRTGEVVDREKGLLTVVFERPSACDNCKGCMNRQCTSIEIAGDAEIGDRVDVSMPEKRVVGASALAYLVPLAALIAGLVLGYALHGALGVSISADLFALALGGVCIAIGFLFVWGIDRRLRKRSDWQPRIVAVRPADGLTIDS